MRDEILFNAISRDVIPELKSNTPIFSIIMQMFLIGILKISQIIVISLH